MSQRVRHAPPRAASMLEALRGLGYSTSSALADIVDNSISAGASSVWIHFDWNGPSSSISILDDGRGMSDTELEVAMTLGAINPLEPRKPDDLGRFGLGLKTASFSQCRRLTVASKRKGGSVACLRWDLDVIAADAGSAWELLEGTASGSGAHLEQLGNVHSGTLVLWEEMDRIVTPGTTLESFTRLVDEVESRLGMVFHRLIDGKDPVVRLHVNGRRLRPWDSFMTDHPAKPWQSPVARIETPSGLVTAQCHVLPHRDMLGDSDFAMAGGPDGWISQQGVYVYRNRRLLVAGGWLGLGRGRAWVQDEAHRLARIRVDIPNSADTDWKIDVRKSIARPPAFVRSWLTARAEDTRDRARRVFAWRGIPPGSRKGETVNLALAWRVEHLRDGVHYRIDQRHPAVSAVLEACDEHRSLVRAMLRVIEVTVPVQRIWLDTAEGREMPRTGFLTEEQSAPEGVKTVITALYLDMTVRRGMKSDEAVKALSFTEPFQNYPALLASMPELASDGCKGDQK